MKSFVKIKYPMSRGKIIRFLLTFLLLISIASVKGEDSKLAWGVNAITLKSPWTNLPSSDALLTNQTHTISLDHFYRDGGVNLPVTPTECRVACDSNALLVVFRCAETNLSFPAIRQDGNWYSLLNAPPDQDSVFPDKVDIFIQPDMSERHFYQFAATLDGLKFGCERHDQSANTADDPHLQTKKIQAFEATVTKKTNEWIVFFRIPWKTLGGKPKSYFGLLPIRTRWRNGEVSSPVAFDFRERPAPDIFIETHFSGAGETQNSQTSLCQLPSGILRWQRTALLSYPDAETLRKIWRMERSLDQPTGETNFARRLYLAQRWIDLLMLEGFNFRAGNGSIAEKGMEPYIVRRGINDALRKGEKQTAYQLLDIFLHKLDKTSGDWFADGSPGDILTNEWKPVSELEDLKIKNNVLTMRGFAGHHKIDLHLSLPATGGVRIYSDNEGYFKPDNLSQLHVIQSSKNSRSIETVNGKIVITCKPFTIRFYDSAGNLVTQIGANDIAFRFNQDGKTIAIDFKNRLDTNEVIYGFGEKYDHFNENGNVLTLWGIDDWAGNTFGLLNQSYKPVPVFHSSKGYMVFDNSTYRLRADIGKTFSNQYRLTQQGPIFDFYFWIGSPAQAIQSYTALTGKPILPPKWAFEPWMGRTGRGWNKPSHNPVAEEESVVERFEKLDIPHSAIYSEGSGADSVALNQFMAARGIKVLSWFFPGIGEPTQKRLMPELETNNLPVLRAENDDIPWPLVDFTHPNALELCRRWWKHRLDIGVAGSMVDFGDRVPEDAILYNGWRGDEMHNFYSYDYQRTYSEVFREKRGDDFILIGRAAAPGTQKFVAQFAGDHSANFAGLQAVLTGALNLCACGFSTWGSDIGGFLGWPEPAVYMRYVQFGCFSPLMRCHGRTPREPWNYGNAAVANYKYFAWVRENLLDYIYNAAIEAHETGIPIMRSMAVAFPDEPSLAAVKGEYMFGGDLLAAPIVSEDDFKTISFPDGKWTSLWTGEKIVGPTNSTIEVSLDKIPVYLKQGAIVPVDLNSNLQFGQSMSSGKVKALIVTPPDKKSAWKDAQSGEESAQLELETNHLEISLRNVSELNYLLVYGLFAVNAVELDGKNLSQADWRMDSTMNRLVIRLPKGKISAAKINVQFQSDNFK